MHSPGSSIAVLARRGTPPKGPPSPEPEKDNEKNIPFIIIDASSEEESIRLRLRELLRTAVK